MSLDIVVDVSEIRDARARLERATAGDRIDLLEACGDALVDATDRHFDRREDPDGRPWDPWSSSYAASGRGVALLERDGTMRRSLRRGRTGGRSVRVGFADPKAGWHHRGSGRLPVREVVGFGADETIAVEAVAVDWIRRQLV